MIQVIKKLIAPKGRNEYGSQSGNGDGSIITNNVTVTGTQTQPQQYSAGQGIDITNGVISSTVRSVTYGAGENITVSGNTISSPNSVQSLEVKTILPISDVAYAALTAKSPDTLYLIYHPEPVGLACSYEQILDIPYGGEILTDNMFTDVYFNYTLFVKYNDGSRLDVTSGSTVVINNGTPVEISANTSTERIMAAQPMVVGMPPVAYSGLGSMTSYIPIYQAGLVREMVNARLEGTWVTDVPATGGTITSGNCSWSLYYIYSDETEELQTHYPNFYYPIEIEVGANTTGQRKELDSFQAMVRVNRPSPLTPLYVNCWITPYQAAN